MLCTDTHMSTLGAHTLTGIDTQTSDTQSVLGPCWAWTLGVPVPLGLPVWQGEAGAHRDCADMVHTCALPHVGLDQHTWREESVKQPQGEGRV